jgi:hypothetical protein
MNNFIKIVTFKIKSAIKRGIIKSPVKNFDIDAKQLLYDFSNEVPTKYLHRAASRREERKNKEEMLN